MPMSARLHGVTPQTIEKIHDLVYVNAACCIGYRTIAEVTDHTQLTKLFMLLAWQRSHFAEELKRFVSPYRVGTLDIDDEWESIQVACWCHDLLDRSHADDPYIVLIEIYRREEVTLTYYEEVARETAGSSIHSLISRHYDQIKLDREKIITLKSAFDHFIKISDATQEPALLASETAPSAHA